MNLIIKIILCSFLLFSCSKENMSEIPNEEFQDKISQTANSATACQNQLFGFADFPFQSIVIDGTDFPFCTPQLCVLINDYSTPNPYFSISSDKLKICETGFENMSHHDNCSAFAPTQITHLQYEGGNEIQFFFEQDFWDCFLNPNNYPGMDFKFEHAKPWI